MVVRSDSTSVWDYYGFTQGMDGSLVSFERLRAERPDILLPANGSPVERPAETMAAHARTYAELKPMLVPNELHRVNHETRQILPHLVFVGANRYAILSRSGKAFLWDYGYVERERVEQLTRRFNLARVDAASLPIAGISSEIRWARFLGAVVDTGSPGIGFGFVDVMSASRATERAHPPLHEQLTPFQVCRSRQNPVRVGRVVRTRFFVGSRPVKVL